MAGLFAQKQPRPSDAPASRLPAACEEHTPSHWSCYPPRLPVVTYQRHAKRGRLDSRANRVRRLCESVTGAQDRLVRGPHTPARWRPVAALGALGTLIVILTVGACASPRPGRDRVRPGPPSTRLPNVIVILADDLGYGDVGAFGQTRIKTPRLDRMAAEGLRLTQFYAGSPVCAPSRATLLTGRHTGHAIVRDNLELGGFADNEERGQMPLPPDTPTLARALKTAGYRTALIGKWGLGGPGSTGVPTRQGFDAFFGYLDQKQAHNHYPSHLWRNETWTPLRNGDFSPHQRLTGDPRDPASYTAFKGQDYALDVMTADAVRFLEQQGDAPFFLYFAPTVPHLALQVPDAALTPYAGAFEETPYTGDRGYLPHPTPRAAYAAMITYMDAQIGRLLDTLQARGLDDNTLVIFTSDNGATFRTGGADTDFFQSVGPLRGRKGEVYEGGIRVPFIARWPDHVPAGRSSDHVAAIWDVWTTLAEISGGAVRPPAETDGVSFAPTLLGRAGQRTHEARDAALYWEYHAAGGSQAVRLGPWKGVRTKVRNRPDAPIELYDLRVDVSETNNLAAQHPDIVAQIAAVMRSRTPSPVAAWNFVDVKPQ